MWSQNKFQMNIECFSHWWSVNHKHTDQIQNKIKQQTDEQRHIQSRQQRHFSFLFQSNMKIIKKDKDNSHCKHNCQQIVYKNSKTCEDQLLHYFQSFSPPETVMVSHNVHHGWQSVEDVTILYPNNFSISLVLGTD